MRSRYKIILALAVIVIIFAALLRWYGCDNTWRLCGVPAKYTLFSDTQTFIHYAGERGFDMSNWWMKVTYPRAWLGLYLLGINETHTTVFGIGLILCFLIGICLFLPRASNATVLMVLAAVLSPAALFGIHQANLDLLLFFLVSVSILAAQRFYVLSALAILIGFALKFYPIFGLAVLLKAKKSKFILYTLIALIFAGCYIVLTFSDILLIIKWMPKSFYANVNAYGMDVFWMVIAMSRETLGRIGKALSYLLVILSSLLAFSALFRNDNLSDRHENDIYLSAFRAGASIYIGTFILANNMDYKLIFMIFAIPQLVLWAKHRIVNISFISKLTIIAIFFSSWKSAILNLSRYLYPPLGWHIGFLLSQGSHWLAFSCFMYLFFWSMPEWVKEAAQKHLKI